MIESTFKWIRRQYRAASPLNKVFLTLVVLVLIAMALVSIPFMRDFMVWLHRTSPMAQTAVMLFFALASVYGVFGTFERVHHSDQVRRDHEGELKARELQHDAHIRHLCEKHELEMAHLRKDLLGQTELLEKDHAEQVRFLKDSNQELQARIHELEAEHARQLELERQKRAEVEIAAEQTLTIKQEDWQVRMNETIEQAKMQLEKSQSHRLALEERWTRILDQEANQIVWRRPDTTNSNAFLPISQRKTHFIAMMNLKGGVGKTTLSANLSACWAQMDRPLRVLVVDLDSQGTLGNVCVDRGLLSLQVNNGNTTARLLTDGADFGMIDQLAVPMNRVDNAHVIFAGDDLETADIRLQNQFMLKAHEEARFRFQQIFHQPQIHEKYDVVVFDCPPRLTASSVNALACCDHIIVPTKLDYLSVSCVPRTLEWIRQMQGVIRAKLLGVIANETRFNGGNLVSTQFQYYTELARILASRSRNPNALVCRRSVKDAADAVSSRGGVVASATAAGRRLFMPLAVELRERLRI